MMDLNTGQGWNQEYFQALAAILLFVLQSPPLILSIPEEIRRLAPGRAYVHAYIWTILLLVSALCLIGFVISPTEGARALVTDRLLSAFVFVAFGLAILFSLIRLTGISRRSIVKRLETRIIRGLRKCYDLKEDALLDLTYIGEQGAQGYEKQIVLASLQRLAERILNDPAYTGTQLGEIVQGIQRIPTARDRPAITMTSS